ncbi:hypothetical protein BC943DRAFT_324555 [Umbelopsis sp. AD052]|nr:hypothetical protein BC943DRAFT_324555 [Umbelopsis sp. AD052]
MESNPGIGKHRLIIRTHHEQKIDAAEGETVVENSSKDETLSGETAVKQAIGTKVPSVQSATPIAKKPVGPTLNTAMLEAKLSTAKKTTAGDSVPNKLTPAGNGLRSNVKPQATIPAVPIPMNQAKATTPAQGIALKGTAKLSLANAVKSNANGTATGKPMSALRAAALASVKGNPSAKIAEPVAKRGGPTTPVTVGKQAAVPTLVNTKPVAPAQGSPNNKQAGKPGLPAKPVVVANKQATAPAANKQPAAQGSPNLNNKQATKKPNAKTSPAGTDDGLQNIKILTFEEIMAQKRAKKVAEQATASPKTGSPRPAVKAPPKPIATTVEKTTTTPPVTQVDALNKANQKPEPVAPSVSRAPPSHPSITTAAAVVPSPVAPVKAVVPQATTPKPSVHSNGNSQIGVKRPAESNPVQPPAKKVAAGEQLSNQKVIAPAAKPIPKVIAPTAKPIPKVIAPTAKPIPKVIAPIAKPTPPAVKNTTSAPPPAQVPAAPTSQKRPLDIEEEAKSNKKQAVDEDDELAQFEAEFGDLEELEGGDIKDFDEESIMKELEELEGDV